MGRLTLLVQANQQKQNAAIEGVVIIDGSPHSPGPGKSTKTKRCNRGGGDNRWVASLSWSRQISKNKTVQKGVVIIDWSLLVNASQSSTIFMRVVHNGNGSGDGLPCVSVWISSSLLKGGE